MSVTAELLSDADDEVRVAAAYAAGRLRCREALGTLDQCLAEGSPALATAAARALAQFGREGLAALEVHVSGGDESAAPAALEALEKQRMGRLADTAS